MNQRSHKFENSKKKKKMINEKTNKLWVENIIVGGDWSEEDA